VKKSALPMAALIFVSQLTFAAIEDRGDYTLDTETGFRWIDATVTRGLSYQEGADKMNPTGDFAGCRFANPSEINSFISKLGIPTNCGGIGGFFGDEPACPDGEAIENAIRLLGDTQDARFDEINKSIDVAPDGAGWTRAIYNASGDGLYIRDEEYVDRATGEPYRDYRDYVEIQQSLTASGAVNAGLAMICESWPTNPFESEIIDFENVPVGTMAPILSKGYQVTGDAEAVSWNGSIVIQTDIDCVNCGGTADYTTSQTIARADGLPFAFFGLEETTFGTWRYLGNCKYFEDGINVTYDDCAIVGTTTWGEKVLHQQGYPYSYPTSFGEGYAVGTGPWLNLQSLEIKLRAVGTLDINKDCEPPCSFNIDNVEVNDAMLVEIDYDPWNDSNIINPTLNHPVTVQINTTPEFSGADVDLNSLRLGPNNAPLAAAVLTADYDGDGDIDYIFGFKMQQTGITCVHNRIILSGQTNDGVPFAASDSVEMHPDCFAAVEVDVEPFDPQNRVYPNDEYALPVMLKVWNDSYGDPYDFYPRSASDLRLGPNRAKPVSYVRYQQNKGEYDYLAAFRMEDTGITCDDTEVEIVGLHNSGSYNGPPFPSGAPAFKATVPIDTQDCDTGSCHP
jgi:hypothetical protein